MASVYRHRDGKRWRAAVVLPNGQRRSRVFKYKTDADLWARSLEADADRGQWTDPTAGRRTLVEYAAGWTAVQRWRLSTREQAESHLRRWILPQLGHRPIGSITNSEVRGWVGHLEEHLAPASVEAVYRRLVSILEGAVADRVIAVNPATVKRIPLPPIAEKHADELVVLGPDDITRLADAVSPWMRAFVWCGATAGLRPGETAGLTLESIDLLRRHVVVDRQLSTVTGGPRLTEPKTRASRRTVPIPDELVTELARHLEQYPVTEIHGDLVSCAIQVAKSCCNLAPAPAWRMP